ncbi:50S ribosomal protein L24 [Candidatus Saccharibacteria bacterium]|nr:MAG: 50S ribosomal protein L24 [Candidatus Saccharibacteria bacterium]
MARLRTGDIVKIVAGRHKGTTGKVTSVDPARGTLRVENVGTRTRKVKPSRLNPTGGSRDIHTPIDSSNVALVIDEKTGATSRVGYAAGKDGAKTRVARQANNKEIK